MSKRSNNSLSPASQLRADWPLLLLIAATLAVAVYIYPQLPDRVPSHWNVRGEVDGYSSKLWGAFGIPLMNAGIYLFMVLTPMIDPRRDNYLKFAGTYRALKILLVCFFTGIYVIVIMSALGYQVSVERIVPLGVSLLFIVIGNYLGRVQHNYFVGIKVPWTLASEEVWRKTHRLAGPLWVAAGFIGVIGAIFGGSAAAVLLFGPMAIAVLVPIIYSFILYNRLQRHV